ncbi:MAG TPA: hypothetical protein VFR21_06420 [Bradyrhizobium sp.]|nr:hypothetical protein [Bradyrhizobium sp.]
MNLSADHLAKTRALIERTERAIDASYRFLDGRRGREEAAPVKSPPLRATTPR